ncbi:MULTISPECIES: helix-turn-helix domain-containing protein [Streptomyces]|uniref:XRE family transcriptional regulator n=1 Tax=Streptomyces tsukubensis (strain DSM 42081 / NBRC 108919 / NRRL 18488 / 9993) TaxID=1114943 RepID=I2N334_STRT9|nr:helix-turn-helix transcriptional regulator [Streptomyces tsukubensis]MYS66681.1 helix-turn-helix domain-containing protein [Streptomyces sp. SID5473]AZK95528.1 transcriptional regulator [Streptomyces tsukubensis]EIF91431.1 Helix-turn-helix protein [Streptomyces tsukubensis NRRL18488]QKM68431.1 XRE family transcriptional regulator [Streptomyces tsukubensis NRRL18488]TAI43248.1 XRE family transcriptional regulator [Streptomyces tsukubensis]
MSAEYEKSLGRKIAFNRKRRGLSQKEFAGLLGRSEAWVSQVERGVRRIDRMTVLEKVAEVLDVPVAELAAEAPIVASVSESEPPGASRLRLVLSSAHSLKAILGQPEPPDIPTLRADVERAWSLTHEGNYADLAELLEDLVPRLESATRAGVEEERPGLFRLLAAMYHTCSAALANSGEPEAAWIAVDRSVVAAERAGDPLLMAAGEFRLSIVFLGARHYEQAARVSGSAADALAPLAEDGEPEAVAMRGALTLQRAVAAGRLNCADDAYAYLRLAKELAAQVGDGRNDYNTEFGPTNVALHEVAVAVDLGDAGIALRAAEDVDASGLSSERQARFGIDLAKAHAQRRQIDRAVDSLVRVRGLLPEMFRAKPAVKQLVADLLAMSPLPSDQLRELARELGVQEVRTST